MQVNRHALRALRQRSGLSVSALAAAAGISQPHLSNIESGKRAASSAVVRRLAHALRVPSTALLLAPEEAPRPPGAPSSSQSTSAVASSDCSGGCS